MSQPSVVLPDQLSHDGPPTPRQTRRRRPHHLKIAAPAPRAQAGPPPDPARPRLPRRWLGLDVHAAQITVAIADADGAPPRVYGTIHSTPEAVRKLMQKLGLEHRLHAVYEAGPTGYWLWHTLTTLGVACDIVAPTRIPRQSGNLVKTDTRDALQLAKLHRAGDLEPIAVPDASQEALRDLVRAREQAVYTRTHARQQLTSFLLRRNMRRPAGMTPWATRHQQWLAEQVQPDPQFAAPALTTTLSEYMHEVERHDERLDRYNAAIAATYTALAPHRLAVVHALQALKGVSLLTAVTIVSELGELSRFRHPRFLMSYIGLVCKEDSTGTRHARGSLTKTGNAHVRRIVTEAAWSYRSPAKLTPAIKARHTGQSERVKAIAWAAQIRLHDRYKSRAARRKPMPQVISAVARELLGFIWAIGIEVERPLLLPREQATSAAEDRA